METRLKPFFIKGLSFVLSVLLVFPFVVTAQDAAAPAVFQAEELEQILAPVALYPDSLLSQILMASTYPLEIVQAQRWVEQNQGLEGDALAQALESQSWDPSVKSLVNFPQVLQMMNEKVDWTQKLGDAVLAQQKDVLDAVQRLRAKANSEGTLKTTTEQTVVVEPATQTIIIESADPQVVYVPTYDPVVVYGVWPYPAYPPYYYYPPGYTAGAAYSFAAGVAVGAAWGYAWGECDWHGGDVDINFNQNNTINTNIDRSQYQAQVDARKASGQAGTNSWQHDPSHRQGVSYRDQGTAQKYNRASTTDTARARESFRGYADQGRQDLASNRSPSASTRPSSGMSGSQNRDLSGSKAPSASTRPSSGMSGSQNRGSGDSAFSGYGDGKQTASQSSRGSQSRQSMSSTQSGSSGVSGGSGRSSGSGSRSSGGGGSSRGGGGRR